MTMYWTQEDRPTRSARVHHADCRYCNNGRGWQLNRTGQNNSWYGPFATTDQARAACRQAVARPCGACMAGIAW